MHEEIHQKHLHMNTEGIPLFQTGTKAFLHLTNIYDLRTFIFQNIKILQLANTQKAKHILRQTCRQQKLRQFSAVQCRYEKGDSPLSPPNKSLEAYSVTRNTDMWSFATKKSTNSITAGMLLKLLAVKTRRK